MKMIFSGPGLVLVWMLISPSATMQSFAGECDYRNVYEVPNQILKEMPIQNQGNTTLCYAYSAAQLTEYYLRTSKQWPSVVAGQAEDQISALWVAMSYKAGKGLGLRFRKGELGNGYIETAFQDLRKSGICDAQTFARALSKLKAGVSFQTEDFILFYEGFWLRRAENLNETFPSALEGLLKDSVYRNVVEMIIFQSDPTDTTNLLIPAAVERQLNEVFQKVASAPIESVLHKGEVSYLRDTYFSNCSGENIVHPKLPRLNAYGLGFASNEKLKRKINEKLDLAISEPVGVGYCSKIYEDGDPGNAVNRNPLLPRFIRVLNDSKCWMHYSMVVGKRPAVNGGGCQYLVRNTFGRDFWTKKYECMCEKDSGEGYENCRYSSENPHSNKVVGCWIDEAPLLNSMYDLAILTNE